MMIPLLRVVQILSFHCYIIITKYYVIITLACSSSINTHYCLFQSPELAGEWSSEKHKDVPWNNTN